MRTSKSTASQSPQSIDKTQRGLSVLRLLHVMISFLGSIMLGVGEELKPISLPKPELGGGKTFMEAVQLRRTIREFGPEGLSLKELSGVLWAGFGINRPDEGRRTAPSAMNSQEVDLYVALVEGLYVYDPKAHQLNPVLAGDFRGKTGQAFATNAAAVVIYVADFSRLEKAKPETRLFYSGIDTGAISQNIYLFCAANDLATVVYDLNREPLARAMELKPAQQVILAQAVGHPKPGAWSALFNGKDLTGWEVKCRPKDKGKIFWKAESGTLLCDSMGRKDHDYVWLISEREYGDFELRLKFQAYRDSSGNSGVQFRSRYDDSIEGGWLHGPQVDIHPPGDMSWRTGLIYDETLEERRWVFPSLKNWEMPPAYKPAQHVFKYAEDGDGWNDLTIRCQGMRVTTEVNGIVRTSWDASGVLDNEAHRRRNVGDRGHFALQLHSGDELRIRFKDLRIREL